MTPAYTAAVRAVVFDMGGVLTADPFVGMVALAEEMGLPPSYIADAVRDSEQFRAVETGGSSIRDFLKWLCVRTESEHGLRMDIRRLAAALASGQEVRPEMPVLIGQLRDAGVQIGLLTNNAREARAWWESGVLALENFDVVLDSSVVGVRKPDPEIFRIALGRMGLELEPSGAVFVDDLQANVDGAVKVGMRGLLFRDPAQCRAELVAMFARSGQPTPISS